MSSLWLLELQLITATLCCASWEVLNVLLQRETSSFVRNWRVQAEGIQTINVFCFRESVSADDSDSLICEGLTTHCLGNMLQ